MVDALPVGMMGVLSTVSLPRIYHGSPRKSLRFGSSSESSSDDRMQPGTSLPCIESSPRSRSLDLTLRGKPVKDGKGFPKRIADEVSESLKGRSADLDFRDSYRPSWQQDESVALSSNAQESREDMISGTFSNTDSETGGRFNEELAEAKYRRALKHKNLEKEYRFMKELINPTRRAMEYVNFVNAKPIFTRKSRKIFRPESSIDEEKPLISVELRWMDAPNKQAKQGWGNYGPRTYQIANVLGILYPSPPINTNYRPRTTYNAPDGTVMSLPDISCRVAPGHGGDTPGNNQDPDKMQKDFQGWLAESAQGSYIGPNASPWWMEEM